MYKYPVITLCGSTRFKNAFLREQKRLTMEGNVVISIGLFGHSGDKEALNEDTKKLLDEIHLVKIDMADEIYVINEGGYVGESTRKEIEYAQRAGKRIRFMEPPNEEWMKVTYTWDDFHSMPFELRQAVRGFWKSSGKYDSDSEVWKTIPENGMDPERFKKAVQLYDVLLKRHTKGL